MMKILRAFLCAAFLSWILPSGLLALTFQTGVMESLSNEGCLCAGETLSKEKAQQAEFLLQDACRGASTQHFSSAAHQDIVLPPNQSATVFLPDIFSSRGAVVVFKQYSSLIEHVPKNLS